MRSLKDKVAVITGATDPLGFALAQEAANQGMRLVLSDINIDALEQAAQQLTDRGIEVIAIPSDVSQPEQVQLLALTALQAFGEIHLLCNNAGKFSQDTVWESAPKDWQWLLNVNLWGIINGLNIFTPIMAAAKSPCHILNITDLTPADNMPADADQAAIIHAIVNVSRSMRQKLNNQDPPIGISVLCPKWASTLDADLDRELPPEMLPAGLTIVEIEETLPADSSELITREIDPQESGPHEIAKQVFAAIRNNEFYVLV